MRTRNLRELKNFFVCYFSAAFFFYFFHFIQQKIIDENRFIIYVKQYVSHNSKIDDVTLFLVEKFKIYKIFVAMQEVDELTLCKVQFRIVVLCF